MYVRGVRRFFENAKYCPRSVALNGADGDAVRRSSGTGKTGEVKKRVVT
jgi:hypothetical protein